MSFRWHFIHFVRIFTVFVAIVDLAAALDIGVRIKVKG